MRELVTAIDRALEEEMSDIKLTREEQKELFGDGFSDDYADEAEQRRRRTGCTSTTGSTTSHPISTEALGTCTWPIRGSRRLTRT